MLHFKQVSLQFPGMPEPTLRNCTFEVNAGEVVVILGPSGCGKTTLLKLVNRLYEATTGQIFINDNDIQTIPLTTLRRRMGYVIQQAGLFPHMTIAQNIAVVPKLLGWSKTEMAARVEALLELVQLPLAFGQRYPSQLSGGQQQRVGLARALAANPEVLLMDEPFGALDAITRKSLQVKLLQLQQQFQKTILFVSHDIEEALQLADRILILNQGLLVQYGTPWQILTQPASVFVEELVGTQDVLKQLSVLPVRSVMESTSFVISHLPKIGSNRSLRQALSILLKSGQSQLQVMEGETAIGILDLNHIQLVWQDPARVNTEF
ncbi:ABC transporter ATP-binding protein [Acaryochloris sp. IP29b_bin.148]|uniref:ABC transporter ATP-binding protein n=1 Tax=Acaryochloris sp. IP29b_bin.148 TaxID=2969218 RepID=UPI0034562404